MAAAFIIVFNNERARRRERVFRDRNNPLDSLSDGELIARYRFPRESILELVGLLRRSIHRPTLRSCAIEPHTQVLTTLRFLAKGEYLSEVGDVHGISVSSASRVIGNVCQVLCANLDNIKFPNSNEERNRVKDGFYRIANFPNVIGCIDGTLIPIQGTSGDEEPNFICRKGFPAINVQAVADADLRFTNLVVRWPGATHDSFILTNSGLPDIMEEAHGWLLGDSGYPLKRWLLTPFGVPRSPGEQRYNRAHCSTRNTVERAFGVLKSRFRCMHKTGGSLQFSAPKCIKVIESCFRLHNKAINERLPPPVNEPAPQVYHNDMVYQGRDNEGFALRNQLVERDTNLSILSPKRGTILQTDNSQLWVLSISASISHVNKWVKFQTIPFSSFRDTSLHVKT